MILRYSLYGSLIIVLIVFAWRGVWRRRPWLTFYLALYLMTRFPPPQPHDPGWVRSVWVPMTSALLFLRLCLALESLWTLTAAFPERLYVRWGSITLGAAAFAALVWSAPDASLVALRQFAQIGICVTLAWGILYSGLQHQIPRREIPVFALLLVYAGASMLDPATGLAARIVLIGPDDWSGILQISTWAMVPVFLSLALAHGLPKQPHPEIEQRKDGPASA